VNKRRPIRAVIDLATVEAAEASRPPAGVQQQCDVMDQTTQKKNLETIHYIIFHYCSAAGVEDAQLSSVATARSYAIRKASPDVALQMRCTRKRHFNSKFSIRQRKC